MQCILAFNSNSYTIEAAANAAAPFIIYSRITSNIILAPKRKLFWNNRFSAMT